MDFNRNLRIVRTNGSSYPFPYKNNVLWVHHDENNNPIAEIWDHGKWVPVTAEADQRIQSIIDTLNHGYQFMGVATPETNPGTPDQNVFYIANPGTYENIFGSNSFVVKDGEIGIIKFDTSWHLEIINNLSKLQEKLDTLDEQINGNLTSTNYPFSDTGKILYGNSTLDSQQYAITDYIDISSAQKVTLEGVFSNQNGVLAYVIYDSDKNILLKSPIPDTELHSDFIFKKSDLPLNASYIRCTQFNEFPATVTVYTGDSGLDARVYTLEHKESEEMQIVRSNAIDIFNNKTAKVGYYISTTTGEEQVNVNFTITDDFIPVKQNAAYNISSEDINGFVSAGSVQNVYFYSANKTFLSQINGSTSFITPSGTAYIRFACLSKHYSESVGFDSFETFVIQNNDTIKIPIGLDRFANVLPYNRLSKCNWMLIGDSITHHNFRAAANYHDFIKTITGIQTTNIAVSGGGYRVYLNQNLQFLPILDAYMEEHPNYKPTFITIMGGINDMEFDYSPIGDITDTTDSTLMGCVNMLVEKLHTYFPTTIVGIMSPLAEIHFNNLDSSDSLRHRINITSEHPITSVNIGDTYSVLCTSEGNKTFTVSELHLDSNGIGYIYLTCPDRCCPKYSGVLTKVSGSGDATITYNTMSSNMLNIFVEKLRKYCEMKSIPFLDQYHCTGLRPWDAMFNEKFFKASSDLEADGLHPNYWGHRLIYPRILQYIESFGI